MKTINAGELNSMMENDADWVVIDVLPEEHYVQEHIPGAYNIPVDDARFTDHVEDIVENRDDPIVVYCANDDCDLSPKAAKQLENDGFHNVVDFEGGIEEWKSSGFPVTQE